MTRKKLYSVIAGLVVVVVISIEVVVLSVVDNSSSLKGVSQMNDPFELADAIQESLVMISKERVRDNDCEKSSAPRKCRVTGKGKQLLKDLSPKLEGEILDIVKEELDISKANLLLTFGVMRLERLRREYNKKKGEEMSLPSIFGTITVRSDELKRELKQGE